MPNYGERCKGCSGEDCVCCEVYLEAQADTRTAASRDPAEDYQDWLDEQADREDEGDQPDESMDGDHASALASAGFGTDEDYNPDTPLGDEYGSGSDND